MPTTYVVLERIGDTYAIAGEATAASPAAAAREVLEEGVALVVPKRNASLVEVGDYQPPPRKRAREIELQVHPGQASIEDEIEVNDDGTEAVPVEEEE